MNEKKPSKTPSKTTMRWVYTHIPPGSLKREILYGSWETLTSAVDHFRTLVFEKCAGSHLYNIQTIQLKHVECDGGWKPLPEAQFDDPDDGCPEAAPPDDQPATQAELDAAHAAAQPDAAAVRPTSQEAEAMISDVLGFVFGDYVTDRFNHFSVVSEYKKKFNDLLHASRSRAYNLRQAVHLVTCDQEIPMELWRDIGDEAKDAIASLRKLRKEHKQEIVHLQKLSREQDAITRENLCLRPSIRSMAFMMESRLKGLDKSRSSNELDKSQSSNEWLLKPLRFLLGKSQENHAEFVRLADLVLENEADAIDEVQMTMKAVDAALSIMIFMGAADVIRAPDLIDFL
jgi:hypothetical protein